MLCRVQAASLATDFSIVAAGGGHNSRMTLGSRECAAEQRERLMQRNQPQP